MASGLDPFALPGERAHMRWMAVFVPVLAFAAQAHAQSADPDPWFGRDKALHFGATAGAAMAGYAASAFFFEDTRARLATGAGFALTLGIAKELNDLAGYGDPSWRDLTWDVVGTAAGLAMAWALDVWVVRPLMGSSAASTSTSSLRLQLTPPATRLGLGVRLSF